MKNTSVWVSLFIAVSLVTSACGTGP
ncbi:MAG: hypothetical protein RIR26_11, partial [Pseudomonadota bacterium]